MPAPGDQHHDNGRITANPFEDVKQKLSEYTAQEIATIASRLEKQLGPEYLSSRPGPAGQKINYISGEKCIQLANEVFGFNGWSSSIVNIQVDFIDEDPKTLKVNLGLSVIVRVTLRDGTFHEDIGYGAVKNGSGKAAAFHKAKKEGTTDGLKRALRNFGNVLGNCIYDRDYLTKVLKIKPAPRRWDPNALHRHSDQTPVKVKVEVPVTEDPKQNEPSETAFCETLEDEFGDFDEADFGVGDDPESFPDEILLPASVPSNRSSMGPAANGIAPGGVPYQGDRSNQAHSFTNNAQGMQAPTRPISGVRTSENGKGRETIQPHQVQRQSNANTQEAGKSAVGNGVGAHMRPPLSESNSAMRAPPGIPPGPGRALNQPSRMGMPPAPQSPAQPAQQQNKATYRADQSPEVSGTASALPTGFLSARAATMFSEPHDANSPAPQLHGNLPTFNPHAESPSIRKTPGVDHNVSKPLGRDLKHVPSVVQPIEGTAPSPMRANFVNPQLDTTRRIGVPGSPSPMLNRNSYRPPTMKRPIQGTGQMRPPLGDIPANETAAASESGGDAKRLRLSGS